MSYETDRADIISSGFEMSNSGPPEFSEVNGFSQSPQAPRVGQFLDPSLSRLNLLSSRHLLLGFEQEIRGVSLPQHAYPVEKQENILFKARTSSFTPYGSVELYWASRQP